VPANTTVPTESEKVPLFIQLFERMRFPPFSITLAPDSIIIPCPKDKHAEIIVEKHVIII
jgi:hypothetical protein